LIQHTHNILSSLAPSRPRLSLARAPVNTECFSLSVLVSLSLSRAPVSFVTVPPTAVSVDQRHLSALDDVKQRKHGSRRRRTLSPSARRCRSPVAARRLPLVAAHTGGKKPTTNEQR
jgi:hypothetical protein